MIFRTSSRLSSESVKPAGDEIDWGVKLNAANTFYDNGRLQEAHEAYGELLENNQYAAWALFALGRIARDRGDLNQAIQHFGASIESDPDFFWAHYERVQAAMKLGATPESMVEYGTDLRKAKWEPLANVHAEHLEKFAFNIWEARATPAVTYLLENLWQRAVLTDSGVQLLLDLTNDEKIIADIERHLYDGPGETEDMLRRAAARANTKGDLAKEISCLEKLWALNNKNFNTYLSLAKAYARAGDEANVKQFIEQKSGLPPAQLSFVELITQIELGHSTRAYFSLLRHARLHSEVPMFPAIRLAYMLSDAIEARRRNQIIVLLNIYHPGKYEVRLLEVNAAIRDQRWDDARVIVDKELRHLDPKPKNVKLMEIELLAHTGQVEEAMSQVRSELKWGGDRDMFLLPAIRIFGEAQQWSELVQLGLPEVAKQTSYEGFFVPLVRAARRLNRLGEVFDRMIETDATHNVAQKATMESLVEELIEMGDPRVSKALDGGGVSSHRLARIRAKARISHAGLADTLDDVCIYYCADRNYLFPALISLVSLAINNPDLARQATFALVVEDADRSIADRFKRILSENLSLKIAVEVTSAIVSGSENLRSGYGIFTGGQSLSLAAYYRIFYARHLARQGRFGRALYIDADTLVRSGLSAVFRSDTVEALRARTEVTRPEVVHARKTLGIKGRYFNSGVLSFDLKHPETANCLDKAIVAAFDENTQLIFQDQCALNVGFDGHAEPLNDHFNFFVTPKMRSDAEIPPEAVILHYLDRPKPWDSLYRREASEWFRWYEITTMLVDRAFDGKLVWHPSSGKLEAKGLVA